MYYFQRTRLSLILYLPPFPVIKLYLLLSLPVSRPRSSLLPEGGEWGGEREGAKSYDGEKACSSISVGDPYVFGPLGSGSISQRYGLDRILSFSHKGVEQLKKKNACKVKF
jgi:hypothetical protein